MEDLLKEIVIKGDKYTRVVNIFMHDRHTSVMSVYKSSESIYYYISESAINRATNLINEIESSVKV